MKKIFCVIEFLLNFATYNGKRLSINDLTFYRIY